MIILDPEQQFLATLVIIFALYLVAREAFGPWLKARALATPPKPDPD